MRLNYNTALQRIPVYLYDASRQPVNGVVPVGAQLQLSKSGAAWANFTGAWAQTGSGVYYYEPPQAETLTDSFLLLKVSGIVGVERVEFSSDIGDRVVISEAITTKRRFPIFLTDINNQPVPSLVLTGASQVQITKNGAAFADMAGTVAEIGGAGLGQGAYYYEATVPEINALGYGLMKVFPTGLPDTRYVYTWNVIPVPTPPAPPPSTIIIDLITPISTISKNTPIIIDVYSTAVPLRRAWVNALYAGLLPDDMVHNSDRFGAAYQGSTNTRTAITNGYRFTLLRDGGWPGTPSITVHAVDTLGYGDEP